MPLSTVQHPLGRKAQAIRVSALTVPENELSRRARKTDALNAGKKEYDLWCGCTAYVSSIAHAGRGDFGAEVRPVAGHGVRKVTSKIQLLMAADYVTAAAPGFRNDAR